MRFKLQKDYIIVLLLLIGSIGLYSCVEEPEIEPVKVPFTMLRMGNFALNTDLTVQIDDEAPRTLARNTVTSAFELTSGARNFLVKDESGNILYNRSFDAISYDESTLYFAGWASTVDTANTFGLNSYSDGYTYLDDYIPPADTSGVFVYNLIPDTPTEGTIDINATFHLTSSPIDTVGIVEAVGFLERSPLQLTAGEYNVVILNVADTVHSQTLSFTEGKRYYLNVTGSASTVDMVVKELNPLPSRPK